MKRWIVVAATAMALATATLAQQRATFTGTVLIYGSGMNTRTTTNTFTMTLNGQTPPAQAQELLSTLQSGGQEDLRRALNRGHEVGRFSIGGRVGLPIEAAVIDQLGDRTRIRAVMERWQGFGELWRGSRSVDYPFSYVELYVDRAGRGEGTFIAAAQIRWRNNHGQNQVEIEDFGTFPGRLMGVQLRGRIPS